MFLLGDLFVTVKSHRQADDETCTVFPDET